MNLEVNSLFYITLISLKNQKFNNYPVRINGLTEFTFIYIIIIIIINMKRNISMRQNSTVNIHQPMLYNNSQYMIA